MEIVICIDMLYCQNTRGFEGQTLLRYIRTANKKHKKITVRCSHFKVTDQFSEPSCNGMISMMRSFKHHLSSFSHHSQNLIRFICWQDRRLLQQHMFSSFQSFQSPVNMKLSRETYIYSIHIFQSQQIIICRCASNKQWNSMRFRVAFGLLPAARRHGRHLHVLTLLRRVHHSHAGDEGGTQQPQAQGIFGLGLGCNTHLWYPLKSKQHRPKEPKSSYEKC